MGVESSRCLSETTLFIFKETICNCSYKARPSPEPSPITVGAAGAARLLEDIAWQELVPWFKQLPAGEPKLLNNMSMEGSRGLGRLTGQNAEPL